MAHATIATDKGDIEIDLYDDGAPEGGQQLHRARAARASTTASSSTASCPGFVIQGGDGEYGPSDGSSDRNPASSAPAGPGYKFADEPFKGDYDRGALAMANAGPNTNGSQFFICLADLRGKLPKNYTRFRPGDRTGMDVVDAIAAAPSGTDARNRRPPCSP